MRQVKKDLYQVFVWESPENASNQMDTSVLATQYCESQNLYPACLVTRTINTRVQSTSSDSIDFDIE